MLETLADAGAKAVRKQSLLRRPGRRATAVKQSLLRMPSRRVMGVKQSC